MRSPASSRGLLRLALLAAGAWLGGARMSAATNSVAVMTFNLRYASASDGANNWSNSTQAPDRRAVVVRTLTNRAPDLVGFQEGEDVQLDYLAQNLPGYGFERRKPSGGGGNENAAFAWNTNRLTLLDRGVFSLGPAPGGSYWNNTPGTNFDPYVFFPDMGLGFPRIALWGRFLWKPTGQQVLFYTTHFDFNDEPQVRSAYLIADDARARNAHMPMSPLAIVVGDFNSSHFNRDWQFFTGSFSTNGQTGDFTDCWWQAHASWNNAGTFHGFAGGIPAENQRIDWILHRGGFTATNAEVVHDAAVATNLADSTTRTQYPSDHYPVIAHLRLPDPPADVDRDGLSDARELAGARSLPADPDTDNDLLVDGQEDLDGNGNVDGGETDPGQTSAPHLPTDIRDHAMDGVRDQRATLVASHGLDVYARCDGRYLYVATQDAGEGSDHFIFVSTNPAEAVGAPWAKAGQVGRWIAFLADENDNAFRGWFDAGGTPITNVFSARAATYFQNGGRLEGVLDLGPLLAPGFTTTLYLAAAPYGTADGGALVTSAQAPDGNGDGNLLGAGEYVALNPGDLDGDGISDLADADRDGDGLPDAWEVSHGLDPVSNTGADGAAGDPDGDRSNNRHEFLACTDPTNAFSVLALAAAGAWDLVWPVPHGKTSALVRAAGPSYASEGPWTTVVLFANSTAFPATNIAAAIGPDARYLRVQQSP